jgi:hypothetical protein
MPERSVDGIFGQETEDEVKKFQRAHGLKDDGVVGDQTHQALAQAMRASGKNYDLNLGSGLVLYDVPLIPQPTEDSCWAAAMAMVVSYARRTCYSPQDIADACMMNLNSSYGRGVVLNAASAWRLRSLPDSCNTPEIWVDYLKKYGPLYVAVVGRPAHGVVLTGGDGAWFHINDPAPPRKGNKKVQTFHQLGHSFEGAANVIRNKQLFYHLPQ